MEVRKRLHDSWEAFLWLHMRVFDDASELDYHEYRQGVRWSPTDQLTLGVQYLFARNETSGKPRDEHRGELDVTPKIALGNFQLSARGRIEFREREGHAAQEEWRLRIQPKIAYPLQVAGHPVTPYVANDLFYDTTAEAWNQNRLSLGATVPMRTTLGGATTGTLFYMLQSQRSALDDWSSNHILGTTLTVRF